MLDDNPFIDMFMRLRQQIGRDLARFVRLTRPAADDPPAASAEGRVLAVGRERVALGGPSAGQLANHAARLASAETINGQQSQSIAVLATDSASHTSTLAAHAGRLSSAEWVNQQQDARLAALEGSQPITTLTLGAGWTAVNGWEPTVSRTGNIVTLAGLVTPSTSPGGTIATLPVWARPRKSRRFTAVAFTNKAVGSVEVGANLGFIASLWSATPTGYINLADSWEAA